MKKLVVLSGAGISAESGIPTFRGADGLWEGHRIEEVATFEAWQADPEKVQRFYNMRRKAVLEAQPNEAHRALAELQGKLDVHIVTQNIDDLHERGGSSTVLHLHGQIVKSRSTINEQLVYPISGWEIKMGDLCEEGSQLRPHIVWFGEAVPMIEVAAEIVAMADFLLVIGTSLVVYPAAGLIDATSNHCKTWVIDPNAESLNGMKNVNSISEKATDGIKIFIEQLESEL